jgi:hypothetical protein
MPPRQCPYCKSPKWNIERAVLGNGRFEGMKQPAVSATQPMTSEEIVEAIKPGFPRQQGRFSHDPKTCKVYGCLQCKEAK